MSNHETQREADFKIGDFRTLAEQYKDDHDPNSKKKPTRAAAKKAPTAGPSTAPQDDLPSPSLPRNAGIADALRFLKTLGSNYDTFGSQCSEVVTCMTTDAKTYKSRVDKRPYIRYICSGGLDWNDLSKSRFRDYCLAAIAAVFECRFVQGYRPKLLEICPGAFALRTQLSNYLFSISKGNHSKPVQKAGDQTSLDKPISKREWFFADLLDDPTNPAPLSLPSYTDLQKMLDASHQTFTTRKSNEITRTITAVQGSQYLLCEDEGVDPGVMETAGYKLLKALYKVSVRAFVVVVVVVAVVVAFALRPSAHLQFPNSSCR